VYTGETTFALPDGRRIRFTNEYVEDHPESVCRHLTFAASKGEEMAKRHPKYTAEAARLSATTWKDPRSDAYTYLTTTSTDADRKAMDAKIAKEYDDLFWSTATGVTGVTTGRSFTTATVASPTSWDYVDYEFAKKELPMNPFLDKVVKMEYVGSRITCNPAPTDTDEDVLLLTDDLETLIGDCIEVGFTRDGDTKASYPEGFVSLRNGSMNFIVTDDEEFYKKFMLATHVCKSLNLMEKNNRITVFQAILYGKEYLEVTSSF
jgi:hypothetical protein